MAREREGRGDAPRSSGLRSAAARLRSAAARLRATLGSRWWLAPLTFLSLAVLHTWPLAAGLGHGSRVHDDAWLNAWAVSWIARQVAREPWRLFDANMFHPHRGAMGYTEPLVVPGVLAAPIGWLGGSPLLVHNVLVLLGFTLTALAVHALVRAWTGDRRAGLLAGVLFAFGTVLQTREAHVQALHAYWLPLAFLAFHRLLTRRRTRDAAWLGACVLGAALTSGYLAVFVCFALGAAALVRARDFAGPGGVPLLLRLAGAGTVTLLALVVMLGPYVQADLRRPPVAETSSVATALSSYLSSAARLHYETWSGGFYHSAPGTLFPGVVTLALAAVGFLRRRSGAPYATRRMLAAAAGVGLVLSLGDLTPVYGWAYQLVPPLQGLRAIHRFGILVVFSLSVLAGIAFSALARSASARGRNLALAVLLALATAESFHGVGAYPRFDYAGRVHRYLAESSWPGAVAELPIYERREFHRNARYLLASTAHWRPLLNGFGGFAPPDFDDTARLAGMFPSVLAVAWLQEIGVGYVVLHTDGYSDSHLRELSGLLGKRRDLALEVASGTTRLYRIRRERSRGVSALRPAPVLSELRFVDGPSGDSMLRAAGGLARVFGFQARDRFIAYMESTGPASRILLRPRAAMSGRFLDAATGAVLRELAVPAGDAERPVDVRVPAGHAQVLLDLQALPDTAGAVARAEPRETPRGVRAGGGANGGLDSDGRFGGGS